MATWPAARSSCMANISTSTGRYVSAWKVRGVTNSVAPLDITTWTVAPACTRRRRERDAKEPRRAGEERLGRDLESWRERPAEEVALGAHDVEVRRRAEVHDDGRPSVPPVGREGVRDAIGSDLRWIVDAKPHAGLDARSDHERGPVEVALRETRERSGQWRDDGSKHERVDVV